MREQELGIAHICTSKFLLIHIKIKLTKKIITKNIGEEFIIRRVKVINNGPVFN